MPTTMKKVLFSDKLGKFITFCFIANFEHTYTTYTHNLRTLKQVHGIEG